MNNNEEQKSTPIKAMEDLTSKQLLKDRRDTKIMIQAAKTTCMPNNRLNTRLKRPNKSHLKRSSFEHQSKKPSSIIEGPCVWYRQSYGHVRWMPASHHLHRHQISLGGSSWRHVTWPDQEAKKAFPMSPSCPAMDTSLLQNPRKWNDKLNSKGRCQWDSVWELRDCKGKKVPVKCNSH